MYIFLMQLDAAETAGVPFVAVFDGHGGTACAEWLSTNFAAYLSKYFNSGGSTIERDITETFLAADRNILAPKKSGIFGMMGERGIGGSKCGATGAVAILFKVRKNKYSIIISDYMADFLIRVILSSIAHFLGLPFRTRLGSPRLCLLMPEMLG